MYYHNGALYPDAVSKNKKRLRSVLGKGWSIRIIDLEPCVYRDLGTYDIEISDGRTKKELLNIYVWSTSDGCRIVETHYDLPQDDEHIKALCEDIVRRYSGAGKDS